MGLFLGLGMGPVVAYYTVTSPRAVWQASGATALFMAGCGTYGYATRRDLGMVGRVSFFALLGLILLSIVLIFIRIPVPTSRTRSSAWSSSPASRCTISSASGGHGA
jgi:modulator of FtsH protease